MDRTSVPTTARRLPGRHGPRPTRAGATQSMKSRLSAPGGLGDLPDACRSADSTQRRLDRKPTSRRIADIDGLGDGTRCATLCDRAPLTVSKTGTPPRLQAY